MVDFLLSVRLRAGGGRSRTEEKTRATVQRERERAFKQVSLRNELRAYVCMCVYVSESVMGDSMSHTLTHSFSELSLINNTPASTGSECMNVSAQ